MKITKDKDSWPEIGRWIYFYDRLLKNPTCVEIFVEEDTDFTNDVGLNWCYMDDIVPLLLGKAGMVDKSDLEELLKHYVPTRGGEDVFNKLQSLIGDE